MINVIGFKFVEIQCQGGDALCVYALAPVSILTIRNRKTMKTGMKQKMIKPDY